MTAIDHNGDALPWVGAVVTLRPPFRDAGPRWCTGA